MNNSINIYVFYKKYVTFSSNTRFQFIFLLIYEKAHRLSDSFYKTRKLVDLIENQTSYELEDSAMHIFETHARAERVELQFSAPVSGEHVPRKEGNAPQ